MIKLKEKRCAVCGQLKRHGAHCVIKGRSGFVWICIECQDEEDKKWVNT